MFSARLKGLRKEKRLTQEATAKLLNVAKTTFASYEQGKRMPDTNTQIKIADLFEVTLDYLHGRNDIQSGGKKNNSIDDLINDKTLHLWLYKLINENPDSIKQLRKVWDVVQNKECL